MREGKEVGKLKEGMRDGMRREKNITVGIDKFY